MIADPHGTPRDRGEGVSGEPTLTRMLRQAVDPVGTSMVGTAIGVGRVASWAWDMTRPTRVVVERAQIAVADATEQLVRRTIRSVIEIALQEVDLTAIVRDHVDLQSLVDTVDLDEVVALVDVDRIAARVDIDAILDRMSLTRIVVERVDLDAVVRAVDLDQHIARVDVGAVVDWVDLNAAAERLDVNAVAARVDIAEIADRVDVNAVARRVDLDSLIATVDIDAVIDRLDLGDIAEDVLDQIDLAGIIRGSTGALSGEAVTALRTQSRGADEAVAVFVRRLFSPSRDAKRNGLSTRNPASATEEAKTDNAEADR